MTPPSAEASVWLERAGAEVEAGDLAGAERTAAEAVRLHPRTASLWNLHGAVLAMLGRTGEAAASFERAVTLDPADPEPRRNLSSLVLAARALAMRELDAAMQRLADGPRTGWTSGRSEGAELQAAHDAVLAALDAGVPPHALPWSAPPVLQRLLAHDALDRLGGFVAGGRRWARAGEGRNLLGQMPRAQPTREDRLEVLHQHRLWGQWAEAAARDAPVTLAARPASSRIRLGFKSSDLRNHVVGAFAWPLFEHLDRDRFDVYVYSFFPGPEDDNQRAIAAQVTAFRHAPEAYTRAAAELIAADALDVLVEIGGPTGWNKPEVMAYRLAPLQVSWMGYPSSLGLSTIDRILLDPQLAPTDPALLVERPLLMPRTWVVMGEHFFRDEPRPAPAPPVVANGFVTFGSASATYKYSRAGLDAWARVVAAVPGSRFLLVRPEAEAPSFRARVLAAFGAQGVDPSRIGFEAIRGGHLPSYGRIDISLDTLPLTGGTTTCESLWMGVPVVSLAGEAMYERLSYSILTNTGLGDLVAWDTDAYVATAAALAGDRARLIALRAGLRDRIRAGPLGDAKGFARDFYDLIARAVAGAA